MTPFANNKLLRKLTGVLLALFILFGSMAVLVGLNLKKLDSLLGDFLAWNGGSGTYLASYDDFLLTASRDQFFKFSSGRGRNSLARLRVQFVDGNSCSLEQLTPNKVKKFFPDATEIIIPDPGMKIVRYSIGFDSFDFVDSELEGITLSKDSGVAIDFGDGQFLELPIDRERLLKLLGPPNKWELQKGGPP